MDEQTRDELERKAFDYLEGEQEEAQRQIRAAFLQCEALDVEFWTALNELLERSEKLGDAIAQLKRETRARKAGKQ